MRAPTDAALRAVRCACLAALVVALSVLAHLCGGGHVPPATTTALLVVPVTGCAWLAARRRWSAPRLLVALGAGQAALHGAFEATMAWGAHPMVMGGGAPAGAHGGLSAPLVTDALAALGLTAPMLAVHLVATALSAVAVAGAEDACSRLWCWLAPRPVFAGAPAATVHRAPAGVEHLVLAPPREALLAAHVRRRGPPVVLARP